MIQNESSESEINKKRLSKVMTDASNSAFNPLPQSCPGASGAIGHTLVNSIPLSIFPINPDKFVFCFCGLPGRGKTHISRRVGRYLNFFHAIPVKVFCVSEYRREMCGSIQDAEWFDPTNEEAQSKRMTVNNKVSADVIEFLGQQEHCVAIIDSTNPTHTRRLNLVMQLRQTGAKVVFVEVVNDNLQFLSEQYRETVLKSPDWKPMSEIDVDDAEKAYRRRVEIYRNYFEPLDSGENSTVESRWSYFKCDHYNRHFVVHNIGGYLPLKVIHFIMNIRTSSHAYYLTRHGQSEYNAIGRIGGDSGLSDHGIAYAKALAEFVDKKITRDENGNEIPARLWTSTLRRTKETGQFIKHNKLILTDKVDPSMKYEWVQMKARPWHHLDELFAGACDGMTYEEIESEFPEEYARRNLDKLAYRYPRGESYLDVIARLEPMIIEMERHEEPLLIIGHQGILRIIYAFYMGLTRAEAPYVSVPLNCVLELVPSAFSCFEQRHILYTPVKALARDGQDEPASKEQFNVDPSSH